MLVDNEEGVSRDRKFGVTKRNDGVVELMSLLRKLKAMLLLRKTEGAPYSMSEVKSYSCSCIIRVDIIGRLYQRAFLLTLLARKTRLDDAMNGCNFEGQSHRFLW